MKSKKTVDYYDKLGDKFDEFMSDYDVAQRHYLIFENLILPDELTDQTVLEVGSGTGRFSRSIIKYGGILSIIDIGPNLVNAVSEELNCEGTVGDACQLPFLASTFDAVVSSECIEHTSDPLQAIREMCRVCQDGGVVCFTTPNKLWYPILVIAQTLKIRKFAGIENWIFPHQAKSIMREEGMVAIQLSGCHLWPFQFKWTRPLLRQIDKLGMWLYPLMINFGIKGYKRQT